MELSKLESKNFTLFLYIFFVFVLFFVGFFVYFLYFFHFIFLFAKLKSQMKNSGWQKKI